MNNITAETIEILVLGSGGELPENIPRESAAPDASEAGAADAADTD